jgi:DNA primase
MSTVDEIKQKLDIVEVISAYTNLKKAGRNYKALCPFHSEKTPSFFVFPEQQTWHCFGACGSGGDVFTFLMKKEGIDFSQALRRLAEKAGVSIDSAIDKGERKEANKVLYDINGDAAIYYYKLLSGSDLAQKAKGYLEKRGFNREIIELFQLGYSKDEYQDLLHHLSKKGYSESDMLTSGLVIQADDGVLHDRFRNRLMFPIHDISGRCVGFGARALDNSMPKYMNSPQNPVFDKSSCLYGVDKAKAAIRSRDTIIITEGYMDVLTSHQFGWQNTVASMGTALTNKQLAVVKRITKNIILAMDTDTAGEEATLRVADSIDIENYISNEVKVVVSAEGKDPDEIIRKNSELWDTALRNALPLIDFIFELIKARYDLNALTGKTAAANFVVPIINRIKDPIKKGVYVQKFAKILNINENYLLDSLKKMSIDLKKKKSRTFEDLRPASVSIGSLHPNIIEDNLLSFLLQNPSLRDEGMLVPVDYFENSENAEIFKKWCEYSNINDLQNNIDTAVRPHLDDLIQRDHPALEGLDNKEKLVFYDYVDRLHEKHVRNALRRKAEILSSEENADIQDDIIRKLEEQITPERERFEKIFLDRKQRRQIRA